MEHVNNTTVFNETWPPALLVEDNNILLDLEQVQNIFLFIYVGIYSLGLISVSIYAIYKEKNEITKQNNHNHNNTSNNSGNH